MNRLLLVFLLGLAIASARVLEFSGVKVELDEAAHKYRISRNGKEGFWVNQSPLIHLKAKAIDPLEKEDISLTYFSAVKELFPLAPLELRDLRPLSGPRTPLLIQFHSQVQPEYRSFLEEELSCRVLFPFPSQALLVECPSAVSTLQQVSRLPVVRWVGDYLPLYRIGPDVFEFFGSKFGGRIHFNVMLVERGPAAQEEVAAFIESLGGKVVAKVKEGFRIQTKLTLKQLLELSTHPKVLYADLFREPGEDMNIVRLTGGLDYLTKIGGFSGEGVRAEVMDSGLFANHSDFRSVNVLFHGANGNSVSHGTSVFGVVFGDGTANPAALGALPNAEAAIFAAYDRLNSVTRYAHTEELVDPTGDYRAVFQTNSWGDAQTTLYTTISAEMDDILFTNDFMILQSQSNTGSRSSRPQAWAKNILSVGAFYHFNTLSGGDDRWGKGASIGPAEDGRQKPDVSHFYDDIFTPSPTGYTQFGGTSGATPITAGHVGILYQMWHQGVFNGGSPVGRDVFDGRPHPSTVKALLINTARQQYFNSESWDLRREHQGWGTADIGRLYDIAQIHLFSIPLLVDENSPITPFEILTSTLTISTLEAPTFLKATLVYRDPMPTPSASKQLINDLDLTLISPSGVVYHGNHGLKDGLCSVSGGISDDVDNVENVFICNAEVGDWKVQVIGTQIVVDTNPSNEFLDAVFSLVVTKGRSA